jgi:hypothetical protein
MINPQPGQLAPARISSGIAFRWMSSLRRNYRLLLFRSTDRAANSASGRSTGYLHRVSRLASNRGEGRNHAMLHRVNSEPDPNTEQQ